MKVHLRYGRRGLDVDLPDANVRAVLRLNRLPVVPDPAGATREALHHPIGAPPLSDLAPGRRNACIVVSDLTRPVPNAALLPPLLGVLEQAGISGRPVDGKELGKHFLALADFWKKQQKPMPRDLNAEGSWMTYPLKNQIDLFIKFIPSEGSGDIVSILFCSFPDEILIQEEAKILYAVLEEELEEGVSKNQCLLTYELINITNPFLSRWQGDDKGYVEKE